MIVTTTVWISAQVAMHFVAPPVVSCTKPYAVTVVFVFMRMVSAIIAVLRMKTKLTAV